MQVRDLERGMARERLGMAETTDDPGELPRSYEAIVLKEKSGITAKPVGGGRHGGTLTVKPEGLEFVAGGDSRTYAASRLRAVSLQVTRLAVFVQVEVDDAGVARKLRFEMAPTSPHHLGYLKQLEKSVQAVIEQRDGAAKKPD